MRGVNDCIIHRRSQAAGCAASVKNDGSTRVPRVAVDALELATLPVKVVRAVGLSSSRSRILRYSFDKDEWGVPAVVGSLAQNAISGTFGRETPIVAGGTGNTSRSERIGVRIHRRVNSIAGAPRRATEIVASAAAAHGMRLVAQVEPENDWESIGSEIVQGSSVGRSLRLRDAVDPIDHMHPIVGPVRLGIVVTVADDVPQAIGFVRIASLGTVVVQDDVQADGARIVDDIRQNVASVLALARRAKSDKMVRGDRIALPHLVGKRHADRVEAVLLDFVQNEGVVLGPQAAGSVGSGFSAVPVDTADHKRRARGIDDLSSAGMPAGGVKWDGAQSEKQA